MVAMAFKAMNVMLMKLYILCDIDAYPSGTLTLAGTFRKSSFSLALNVKLDGGILTLELSSIG